MLHDLDEVGLLALLALLAHPSLHIAAAGVSLNAAAVAAAALRATQLDHHVAKFACVTAAIPLAAVEDQTATNAGSPPDAEQRVVGSPCPELVLSVDCHADVVAKPNREVSKALRKHATKWEGFDPVRQVAGVGDRS